MFSTIKIVYGLFDPRSQKKVLFFGLAKILLGAFDVIGIVLVGTLLARLASSSTTGSPSFSIFENLSLLQLGFLAAASFVTKALGSIVFLKALIKTLSRAHAQLGTDIFEHLINNISWTTKNYSKSQLNFLLTIAPGAAVEILLGTITLISESFLLISILTTFLFVDIKMTLFIVFYFALIAITLNYVLSNKIKKHSILQSDASILLTAIIYDTIGAFREIKSLKRERYFLEKFQNAKFGMTQSTGNISFFNSLPKNIVEPALMLGALGLVFISISSKNPVGAAQSIGIFLTGGLKIMGSMLPLQATFAAFNNQIVKIQILIKFISNVSPNLSPLNSNKSNNALVSEPNPIGIEISNLDFRYNEVSPLVLSDINMIISPGQLVAFIGPSGSGKSTLADLIIGINEPSSGEIRFLNDSKVRVDPDSFKFGYVAQNPGVISGTVKDNIALGLIEEEIDSSDLNNAIKDSHLSGFIQELPLGYETDLGKQSDAVSGGQLQRIGLARALYVKPNILVLDEATSALDVETEAAVSASLNDLKGQCTLIVIAHRLTTVQNADVVFVMNEGKLVAQGKFAELVNSNEIVAKFVELSELKTN